MASGWLARIVILVAPCHRAPRSLPNRCIQTSLRVKSVIAEPRDDGGVITVAAAGDPLTIRGAAWSGDAGPVTRVDVSVDEGRSWSRATMPATNERTSGGACGVSVDARRPGDYYDSGASARRCGSDAATEQEWNPSATAGTSLRASKSTSRVSLEKEAAWWEA